MKKLFIQINYLLGFWLLSLITQAQSSTPRSWLWAKHPNGSLAPYSTPALSADDNGNTYVTGSFVGSLTFPTLPGPTILTSAGENDIFVAKYDALGSVLWAKRFGDIHGDGANAIRYDGFGNLYVVGSYVESTNFDGTILTNPTPGRIDVYIAKVSAVTGNLIWVQKGAGGNSFYYDLNGRAALDVAVDNAGSAYVTGNFTGDITFSPLPTLSTGWWDIFVVKYSNSGVPQWATSAGSVEAGYGSESGNGIAVDQSGNVFVTGTFNGSSNYPTYFGNIPLASSGGGGFYESNFFLAKYNPSTSSWEWAVEGGAASNDYGKKVSLDNQGNAYVSGYFEGTGTFGPSTLTATNGRDFFIAKYSTSGNQIWIHPVEGAGYFTGNTSKVDSDGNLYFAGTFDGTVTVGDQTLTSNGFDNTYVSAWNSNGDFQWVKQIPGDYYSHIHALDVEANGNIDIATVFASTETFDCTVLGSGGFWDMAVAKLGFTSSSAAPTVQASANNICSGINTTLSIINGNLNNATEWKWYTGSCGGTLIGTGSSITVSPTQSTTYYVRSEGGCGGPGNCSSVSVAVNNTLPVINSVTGPVAPVAINTSINLDVLTTTNNIASAKIIWGDASTEQIISNPAANFTAAHTYYSPGVYTVRVAISDGCGNTSSEYQYQYIVVYDPNGGFVTGGGWINSPAGAYRSDVTMTGKAIFGFESKYQKGVTIPTGNTEFKFQAGSLNFKSSNYEWLVVSGSRAQFKGSGTINGTGSYGFMLTAVDGDLASPVTLDLFRIKIWDKANNDVIVYDNQYGAADNGALTTQIAGGSIIIHTTKSGQYSATNNREIAEGANRTFTVTASPNPSSDYFKLTFNGNSANKYSIKVTDILGRAVEVKNNVSTNGLLIIGEKYQPGVYVIEVRQGMERKTLKLIKQ